MKAIILLGHGSRVPGAGEGMERATQLLKERYEFQVVESCYMSRRGPHFPETLAGCVEKGATEILVIPYFLNTGLHIQLDIPEMMQTEAVKYPDIRLVYGKLMGYDDLIVDILKKRIEESEDLPDVRELKLAPRDAFPVPEGQGEFVEMSPEEAKRHHGGRSHHHHN
jgi:sirohydrochlorin ferrochelatase